LLLRAGLEGEWVEGGRVVGGELVGGILEGEWVEGERLEEERLAGTVVCLCRVPVCGSTVWTVGSEVGPILKSHCFFCSLKTRLSGQWYK
jgi:hypothetical protein